MQRAYSPSADRFGTTRHADELHSESAGGPCVPDTLDTRNVQPATPAAPPQTHQTSCRGPEGVERAHFEPVMGRDLPQSPLGNQPATMDAGSSRLEHTFFGATNLLLDALDAATPTSVIVRVHTDNGEWSWTRTLPLGELRAHLSGHSASDWSGPDWHANEVAEKVLGTSGSTLRRELRANSELQRIAGAYRRIKTDDDGTTREVGPVLIPASRIPSLLHAWRNGTTDAVPASDSGDAAPESVAAPISPRSRRRTGTHDHLGTAWREVRRVG